MRARIEDIFAPGGFRSIGKQDLRSRMRWWGLYTQRTQGVPGERTGSAEPEELEDEFFMMRIRIDGGAMTSEQLRAIAWASERHGRDVADVTDRQNVQLHWIRIEDVPAIWERIESVGLTTQEACGDTPRVILGCPLAGVTDDELFDATPDVRAVAERFVGDPAFSNLPRKYKTSISACRAGCTNHEINDVSFVGVAGPGGELGYDLQVGGGLSTNPMFAQRLGAFVPRDRVPEVWAGVTGALPRVRVSPFPQPCPHEVPRQGLGRRAGARGAREGVPVRRGACPTGHRRRRRRWPTASTWGSCRSATAGWQWGSRREPGGSPVISSGSSPVLAERFGSGGVRATAQQKLVIVDVDAARADELVGELDELDLRARGSAFRRSTMACTGIEFCKLAIGETKGRAAWLTSELEARLPAVRRGRAHPRERLPELVRPVPGRRHRADVGAAGAPRRHEERRLPGAPRRHDG